MEVLVKKLNPYAVIPTYAHEGDAGLDMTAIKVEIDEYGNYVYHTGLAFEIPKGYVGLLFPRSSNSKKDLRLCNAVGVLDSIYRGEVTFKFRPTKHVTSVWDKVKGFFNRSDKSKTRVYEVWDRVGQLIIIPYPSITLVETNELSETERGEGGYGSTGK